MPAARGDRRKAAVWPTSAAVSSRASGEVARVYSIMRWMSPIALAAREASGPAEMGLTRTPNRRPASKASVRVSDSSAAFADDIPPPPTHTDQIARSEEHTSQLQYRLH